MAYRWCKWLWGGVAVGQNLSRLQSILKSLSNCGSTHILFNIEEFESFSLIKTALGKVMKSMSEAVG
ncbi:hypothetical protein AVI53_17400 (plasmid) [Piscirickettsia salmonis]|nr:hypothetical protein PSLF89_08955 [Piscirickettsia salmonis LF-89 = ATCC VR-1361]ALY04326.1 hypothetical protein AWE47_17330 [Piscirickettsia salmonis]AMA44073.1 hypothetical protein AWJ11_16990 [Piscirickettsia salmonis]AOS36880.1 hypothetical protein AVM72_16015 [Piscirickettsia salmonis]APS62329.1 hypothetical protein AVI53_17400 [Piscirickettsia salmonis]